MSTSERVAAELLDDKGNVIGFAYEPTEQERKITQAWLVKNTVPEVVSDGPYYGVRKK